MRRIKTAVVGLGRLGYQHAYDVMFRIPEAELVAACSVVEEERNRVKEWGVALYSDYDEMLGKQKDIEAVVIVSPSGFHAAHIESALKAGKHVFCEKPLALTVEECERVVKICEAYTEQCFQLGFMRRYDPSYAEAKRKIDAGEIGRPIMIKATSLDPISAIEGFLRFAPTSGGEFLDMAVHDIDLALWYMGDKIKTIYAVGDAYCYPELKDYKDGDNVCGVMQFENGAVAILHAGRLAPNGYQVETEIVGTKATLRISAVPNKDRVQIYNCDGVLVECVQTFNERFDEAYLLEKEDFFGCILEGRTPICGAMDGLRSAQAAYAATEAYQTGEIVRLP